MACVTVGCVMDWLTVGCVTVGCVTATELGNGNSETETRLMGKLLKASIDNLKACTRTSSNKLKARLYTTYISYMASQRWRSLKEVHAR